MYKLIQLLFLITSTYLYAQIPTFIEVPGGAFEMGNDGGKKNEIPAHEVTLKDFKISQTEITVAQYRLFCNETLKSMPEAPSWGWEEEHPIVNVSWFDATYYCVWLSKMINKDVKLPTEAQWEYAARAARSKNYTHSGGEKMVLLGWSRIDDDDVTHPVGKKKPNRLGLYDMNGNVWEWCSDWYSDGYYSQSLSVNPENKDFGPKEYRVARGGSWDSDAATCSVYHRMAYKPMSSYNDRGFRVVIN